MADLIVGMAVEGMVVCGYRLEISPGFREVETTIEGAVGWSFGDSFVDVDERDNDSEIDDGSPEADLDRPESEGVLALHGGSRPGERDDSMLRSRVTSCLDTRSRWRIENRNGCDNQVTIEMLNMILGMSMSGKCVGGWEQQAMAGLVTVLSVEA